MVRYLKKSGGAATLLEEPQECGHATAAAASALPMKTLEDRENIRAFSLHQLLDLAHDFDWLQFDEQSWARLGAWSRLNGRMFLGSSIAFPSKA